MGRALELISTDNAEPDQLNLAARTHNQRATVRAFLSDGEGAAKAYTQALILDPNSVDLGGALSVVGNARFSQMLSESSAGFIERHGKRDSRDATLQWWLGWSLFNSGEAANFENAEAAFQTSLAKYPAYTSSYYYLALVRSASDDQEGALTFLRKHAKLAPEELHRLIGSNGGHLSHLTGLLDHYYQATRLEESSFIGELLANGFPTHAPYWNNLGLFLRDHGATVAAVANQEGDQSEEKQSEIAQIYERAYNAYLQALDLDSENPAYLNDTAVILHYYLERDYENALQMYARAAITAQEQLDSGDVPENQVEIVRTALRDAKNNRALLEKKMTEEAQSEQAPAGR